MTSSCLTTSNFTMRISALKWMPWVDLIDEEDKITISGPMANLLNNLALSLNFKYELLMPADRQWGMIVNNSWTGMIGMLHRKEADLAIGPFARTYDRSKVSTFTSTVATNHLTIMAGHMKDQSTDVFGYILTFDWQVWLGLFIGMIVLILTSLLTDAIYDPEYRTFLSATRRAGQHFWTFFATVFSEASPNLPDSTPGRLLVAVWWLAIIVLMNAFSGHMKACILLKKDINMIQTLKDLVAQGGIQPLVWKGTAYEAYLRDSHSQDVVAVWKIIKNYPSSLLTQEEIYNTENLRAVLNGQKVIIKDIVTMTHVITSRCHEFNDGEFYFAKEIFFKHNMAMAMRKDLDPCVKKEINRRIRWLVEGGLFEKWLKESYGELGKCSDVDHSKMEVSFGLQDVGAIFILWLIFISISTAAFFLELCYHVISKYFGIKY
ncbi:glutamate receptor-like [Tachypleus tridentatus]|uniref:glutamate receptor-like n=1 Tax=Tachypleus tridentatus TaxID=6853 RepID=UPI003FD5C3CC